ncbi:hypothetical protein IWZ01DRAFT_463799 [Phyllosticta capitalensis]
MTGTAHFYWASFVLLLHLPNTFGTPSLTSGPSCRCMPGDACWPSTQDWNQLNKTVEGRLMLNVPLAHVCHDPFYNQEECEYLKEQWILSPVHETSSTSVMAPWFQNASCDPFTPRQQPCELGNYPIYSINVSSAHDVAAGLSFAREMNIRLVVRNTGHDFLGKSAGKGALSLWTGNMKSIEVIKSYESTYYSGPALKMAAGVRGVDAYEAANANGLMLVGGSCPSVGLVGGYTQGGGHGMLSSSFGMGADQVLEWEVITAEGKRIVATPEENADLYWALSGGGGGAYGVALSMTARAHEDRKFSGAALSFSSAGITNDTFWEGFSAWQAYVPKVVDAGVNAGYQVTSSLFTIQVLTYPNATSTQTRTLLKPFTDTLERLVITYSLNVTSHSNYFDHFVYYLGPLPGGEYEVNSLVGGRLIPREAVSKSNEEIVNAIRFVAENTSAVMDFFAIKSHPDMAVAPNAVLPAWRSAVITSIYTMKWNFSVPRNVHLAQLDELNDIVIPRIDEVTPGSGAYLNEASFADETWKWDFYGVNYDELTQIKKKWDPNDVFYGPTMVGSDVWAVAGDGRLCRA